MNLHTWFNKTFCLWCNSYLVYCAWIPHWLHF